MCDPLYANRHQGPRTDDIQGTNTKAEFRQLTEQYFHGWKDKSKADCVRLVIKRKSGKARNFTHTRLRMRSGNPLFAKNTSDDAE